MYIRADPGQPGQSQMGDSARFFPHLSFYATVSPPQHSLTMGMWINPDGEIRLNTKCPDPGARDMYWNVVLQRVSNTDWTFIAISTSNSTTPNAMTTYTNLGTQDETDTNHPNCLFNEEYLFKAISFKGNTGNIGPLYSL